VRASLGPRAAHASPTELFALLRSAIEPLQDAHTFIIARSIKREYQGFRGGTWLTPAEQARLAGIVDARLTTPLRTWARGAVAFAMLPDSIAYLRITRFEGYTTDGIYEHDRLTLDTALDAIFADTRAWRGLAIDVRVNSGGADPLGLEIASRLATAPYLAYTKVARSDPNDPRAMTEGQPSVVRPSDRPGWRGAVVELTSRYTVSAGETFTQAIMGRQPAIERIGENTQGVFSDVLERKLPNGWRFGLPNEIYLTPKDSSFDVTGIPPTIPVPTFTHADVAARRDPGLDRAMALLLGT